MAHIAQYRQAHPLPFVITHWINLLCMFSLIFTGFCIHFPFFPGFMGAAKGFHICAGFVIFINCIVRIVLSFFIKSAPASGTRETVPDFKTWLPQADNKHQGWQWIKYYLFLRKTAPLQGKLNVPQKIAYLCIPILIIFQFWTGLCIWETTMGLPPFADSIRLVGGIMTMRIIHYFTMYVFIMFIFLHVYLSFIDGLDLPALMLFRREHGGLTYDPKRHVIDGEDDTDYPEIRRDFPEVVKEAGLSKIELNEG